MRIDQLAAQSPATLQALKELLGVTQLDVFVAQLNFQANRIANLAAVPGPQGETGPQGIDGAPGLTAYQHALNEGFVGTLGDWLLSLRGEDGLDGAPGAQGIQGPQRIQGPQGAQGIQGPKGDTGDTGPQGLQGIQGIQGPKGDAGDPGPQGLTGAKGDQGPKGDKGDTGDTGPAGTNAVWTQITQAAYDALSPPDAGTLYVIVG